MKAPGRPGTLEIDDHELVGQADWVIGGDAGRKGRRQAWYAGYVCFLGALAYGFPIVQAMAAGVPVITSAVSAMPEVAGGAAELIDPRSIEELRAALERLLLSPSQRSGLSCRGRERAQRFRWETCAAESLQFFDQVAGAR